jgi:hypothetical protein
MASQAPTGGRRVSPKVCERELRRRLVRARIEARSPDGTPRFTSRKAAADALPWKTSTQDNLETGAGRILPEHLDAIFEVFDIAEPDQGEWRWLADAAGGVGWWDAYGTEDLPPTSKEFIAYEYGAVRIRAFEPLIIHGVLQQPGYREAVLRGASLTPRPEEQLEVLMRVSQQRQQILTGEAPVELRALLDEATLHRTVGPPEVMQQQLEHLADIAEEYDHLTVQVIPFDAGPHAGLGGSFSLFEFGWPDDAGFVYLESGPDRTDYLDGRSDIYLYSQVFARLSGLALTPEASVQMLRDVARRPGARKARP